MKPHEEILELPEESTFEERTDTPTRRKAGSLRKVSRAKQSGDIPTGGVGLIFTTVFCAWIAVSPGGLYSVFLGGALGFAGLVISIVGIAKGSGRMAGVFGIVVFILGWVINTAVVGRI